MANHQGAPVPHKEHAVPHMSNQSYLYPRPQQTQVKENAGHYPSTESRH